MSTPEQRYGWRHFVWRHAAQLALALVFGAFLLVALAHRGT